MPQGRERACLYRGERKIMHRQDAVAKAGAQVRAAKPDGIGSMRMQIQQNEWRRNTAGLVFFRF
jgi:hypothetical protein